MRVGKKYSFEAAHRLPNHKGKCAQPHGHSYRLEVEVEGPVNQEKGSSSDGMVMDFLDLDMAVCPVVDTWLDHKDLNALLEEYPTTAENILGWIVIKLQQRLTSLSRVRLYETEKCWAEWTV